jgi:hypothetical protein
MKATTAGVVDAAEHDYEANRVFMIFAGSDGDATRALYDELAGYGIIGLVAVNLFRAQKCSARAKVYHHGKYSTLAYGRKNWSLGKLTGWLSATDGLGYAWGWKLDPTSERYPWVLYVDLPQGQVSFHAPTRGVGPDYAGAWDGIVDASTGRILRFVNAILHPTAPPLALVPRVTHERADHQTRNPRRRRTARRVLRPKRAR